MQVKILENHQNGKDTHLRGLQVFARDGDAGGKAGGEGKVVGLGERMGIGGGGAGEKRREVGGLKGGGWMEAEVLR